MHKREVLFDASTCSGVRAASQSTTSCKSRGSCTRGLRGYSVSAAKRTNLIFSLFSAVHVKYQ